MLFIKSLSNLIKSRRFINESLIKEKIFAYIDGIVELPKLDYNFKDLEPIISEDIMRIHYEGHHQTYINKYLEALRLYNSESMREIKKASNTHNSIIRRANFNGGGYLNHCIFWKSLVPLKDAHEPPEHLLQMINRDFGKFETLLKNINIISSEFQGSGWIWLAYDISSNLLSIATTDNQDSLQMKTGLIPLLGIDLWEHAYYLQYKNNRAAYVENMLKIMNWNHAASLVSAKQMIGKKIFDSKY